MKKRIWRKNRMEKLKYFLNFINKDGSITTFFNGCITKSQILLIVICIIICLLIIKFLKKLLRYCLLGGIIAVSLYLFVQIAPVPLTSYEIEAFGTTYSIDKSINTSSFLKKEDGIVSVKLNEEWIPAKEIISFQKTKAGYSVRLLEKDVFIDTTDIVNFLDYFQIKKG